MKIISSNNIFKIIKNTLNYVDQRLIGHGERVAFIMYKILQCTDNYNQEEALDLSLLGLLHDIGAYKTENIDNMVQFESTNIWEHSIYGYLFLKNFSPLVNQSKAVLYHHLPYYNYSIPSIQLEDSDYAGLINLADRIDILLLGSDADFCLNYVSKQTKHIFSSYWTDLFFKAENKYHIIEQLKNNSYYTEFEAFISQKKFTLEEKNQYLSMIAYTIDFRSECMVLHTITTVSVSRTIAEILKMSQIDQLKIYYGSLLHDVGKINCPVEILEKPSKLTTKEMEIMKNHVVVSGIILGEYLDSDIKQIAIRHHEKLDGSGYTLGLTQKELNTSERIVAIADIISALIRKRSYKTEFNKDSTLNIIKSMRDNNKICPYITAIVIHHYDQIINTSFSYGEGILNIYNNMQTNYQNLFKTIQADLIKDQTYDEIVKQL